MMNKRQMHIILHDMTVYFLYVFILKIYNSQLWCQQSSHLPFGNHFPGKWRSGNPLSRKRVFRVNDHPGKLLSWKRLYTNLIMLQLSVTKLWITEHDHNSVGCAHVPCHVTHYRGAKMVHTFEIHDPDMLPLNRDDKPHDFNLNLVTWSWDAAYL